MHETLVDLMASDGWCDHGCRGFTCAGGRREVAAVGAVFEVDPRTGEEEFTSADHVHDESLGSSSISTMISKSELTCTDDLSIEINHQQRPERQPT